MKSWYECLLDNSKGRTSYLGGKASNCEIGKLRVMHGWFEKRRNKKGTEEGAEKKMGFVSFRLDGL